MRTDLPQPSRRWLRARKLQSDTGLLLFNPVLNRLFAFNDSARLLWEEVERGSGIDEIAARFVATYGIPLEIARHDINAMIENWRALDLLADDHSSSPPGQVQAPLPDDWSLAPPAAWEESNVYT